MKSFHLFIKCWLGFVFVKSNFMTPSKIWLKEFTTPSKNLTGRIYDPVKIWLKELMTPSKFDWKKLWPRCELPQKSHDHVANDPKKVKIPSLIIPCIKPARTIYPDIYWSLPNCTEVRRQFREFFTVADSYSSYIIGRKHTSDVTSYDFPLTKKTWPKILDSILYWNSENTWGNQQRFVNTHFSENRQ